MMTSVRVGIVGGSGYTGGELLRLLLRHPRVEVLAICSRNHAGKRVTEVHTDLLGETELRFAEHLPEEIEVAFLCLGHGEAREYLRQFPLPSHLKLIDLSQDYRIADDHGFVYGLPELQRERLRTALRIANPGCFATCIQLALLPLAHAHAIESEIHVSAITGSTGAGQKLAATSHYSWRHSNVSVYKPFTHQHLAEIYQSLRVLHPRWEGGINFIPLRGSFSRGILSAVYVDSNWALEQANQCYGDYYAPHPFVHLASQNPDVKQVVNTNKCIVYLEKHKEKLLIVSVIDNLLKGASGQAVQNMNLMCGFDETMGLQLKATAF